MSHPKVTTYFRTRQRLCPRAVFKMNCLNKIVSAFFRICPSLDRKFAFPPSSVIHRYKINNSTCYRDSAIPQLSNSCANSFI